MSVNLTEILIVVARYGYVTFAIMTSNSIFCGVGWAKLLFKYISPVVLSIQICVFNKNVNSPVDCFAQVVNVMEDIVDIFDGMMDTFKREYSMLGPFGVTNGPVTSFLFAIPLNNSYSTSNCNPSLTTGIEDPNDKFKCS